MRNNDITWSRNLFAALNEGGTWCVPRSGLVFNKRGGALVLITRLPGFDSAEQESDLDAIAAHFSAAGIEVRHA